LHEWHWDFHVVAKWWNIAKKNPKKTHWYTLSYTTRPNKISSMFK
jgi:hypothetical protein